MQNQIPYSFCGAVPPRPPASKIQFQGYPLPSANSRSASVYLHICIFGGIANLLSFVSAFSSNFMLRFKIIYHYSFIKICDHLFVYHLKGGF